MTHKADVVIVTATDIERDAVLAAFRREGVDTPTVAGYPYFDYGAINGARIVHATSRMGADGPGEMRDSVQRAIAAWKPWAVIAVGICWGAREGAKPPQRIGDIILSQKLQDTAHVKLARQGAGKTKVTARGLCVPGSDRLENLLASAAALWQPAYGKPAVKPGLMLSQPTLYNDKSRRDEILKLFPEALGGEMEGRGLYFASRADVEWLVLKAVCDWGYAKDGAAKDDDQAIAARNAAGLLRFAMERFSFAGTSAVEAPPAPTPQDDALLKKWHAHLAAECEHLPLGAIDPKFIAHDHAIRLADVYQDLDVLAPKGKDGKEGGLALLAAHEGGQERRALIEVLAEDAHRTLVLLGEAGSGKTTFVDYLCLRLAGRQAGRKEPAGLPELPPALLGKPVVRLVLRRAAAAHIPADADKGCADMIWDAIAAELAAVVGKRRRDEAVRALQARIDAQGAVLVLDGLDEVPESNRRRELLVEAVQDFVACHETESGEVRMLLTARPYAYRGRWQLPGVPAVALAPFSEPQEARYIGRFFHAVRAVIGWDETKARAETLALSAALADKPRLRELAGRPLQLTMMAILHAAGGRLPDDRSKLMDAMVDLYLESWQRQRIVTTKGVGHVEPGIAQCLAVGRETIRPTIARLALQAHRKQLRDGGGSDGCADIPKCDIVVAFHEISRQVHADTLCAYLEQRAGLLKDRGPGVYAFIHRWFQEYLAACALLDQPDGHTALLDCARTDPFWWREVFLFGMGSCPRGLAVPLLKELVADAPAPATHIVLRTACLAARAMVDCNIRETRLDALARKWLLAAMQEAGMAAKERVEAGDLLGRIGDPRFDAAPFFLPLRREGDDPLAPPGFVRVAGNAPFVFGRGPKDERYPELAKEKWFENEFGHHDPACRRVGYDYWIARYPVTVAQWSAFVDDGGYGDDELWSAQGVDWREGRYGSTVEDPRIKDWLAARTPEMRRWPRFWDEQARFANRPVTGICWFEAMAYARWLNGQLAAERPTGYEIRLPTELEWEKAARVTHGGMVPWAAQPALADAEHANMGRSIGHASPVGAYPLGRSALGLEDMVGNVWEWTCSLYSEKFKQGAFRGGRALGANEYPVVRGGSWYSGSADARCAVRYGYPPDFGYYFSGLRLVLSLANSES